MLIPNFTKITKEEMKKSVEILLCRNQEDNAMNSSYTVSKDLYK